MRSVSVVQRGRVVCGGWVVMGGECWNSGEQSQLMAITATKKKKNKVV